jgi:hypothetical protein
MNKISELVENVKIVKKTERKCKDIFEGYKSKCKKKKVKKVKMRVKLGQ